MITSIFSKSKPINFLIVFFITLLAFVVANVNTNEGEVNLHFIFSRFAFFLFCYLSILMLNFIAGKNNLTQKNSYEILLYSLFILMIPQSIIDDKILISNFFILLALRRILSLRSQISLKKKLFDTSFWIGVATLFYFWAILFFFLIYAVLMLFTDNKIKNWIVPFTGITSVFLISISYSIIVHGNIFEAFNTVPQISFDFSSYNSIKYIVAITIIMSFGVWASIFYLNALKKKMKKFRPVLKAIFVMLIIAFVVMVIAPQKNGSEFLFLFPPLSIVMTNYIEKIKEKWFKEIFLLILILVPFVILML